MEQLRDSYERKSIDKILAISKKYMLSKGYKLGIIVENNRDGGYVSYKKGNIEIRYTFLPNYDIEIIKEKSIINILLSFLGHKQNKTDGFISVKQEIKTRNVSISDSSLELFFEKLISFNTDNNLF